MQLCVIPSEQPTSLELVVCQLMAANSCGTQDIYIYIYILFGNVPVDPGLIPEQFLANRFVFEEFCFC